MARLRRMGRPKKPEGAMRQVAIRFPEEMLEALDAIAAERLDRPDRASVVREIIAQALEARMAKGKGAR